MKRSQATDGKPGWRFENGLHMHQRDFCIGLCICAITAMLTGISLSSGVTDLNTGNIMGILFGHEIDSHQKYALWQVRLPHILLGFMVGWCAALAGAIMQSITHNELADPSLFGVSRGTMTTIVVLLFFFPDAPRMLIALASLAGGLAVALLLTVLVSSKYSGGLALLLMGLAISSVLSAISTFLLLYLPTELSLNLAAWMEGSLFQANWYLIANFFPLLLLSILGIMIIGPALNRYQLGSEVALALGEPVNYSRPWLMMFSVLLSAASVTAVGPLAFLGILSPHIASFLSAPTGRARLFLSGMIGGNLVIAADIITKTGPADIFLPVGLSFTLIGVPLFVLTLWLRAMRKS